MHDSLMIAAIGMIITLVLLGVITIVSVVRRVERKIDLLAEAIDVDVTAEEKNSILKKHRFSNFLGADTDPYNQAFEGNPKDRRITNEASSM